MNGRFYDQRLISATLSDGQEKFSKSDRDTEEEQRQREEQFGKWIEDD